jgi:hypothetical protein
MTVEIIAKIILSSSSSWAKVVFPFHPTYMYD